MDRKLFEFKEWIIEKIRRRLTITSFNQLKDASFERDCDVDYIDVFKIFCSKWVQVYTSALLMHFHIYLYKKKKLKIERGERGKTSK